ncbi:MAG: hemolysin family protein [Muribaculaceae bacterium]|nr:hemolysin family protein [Muribaculaceae bacterium]
MSWLIIAIISLLLSAMFSGVEIAFVSADRVRAELDTHKGGLSAKIIDRYFSRPDFFISTLLVGNNIVLVIYGMAGAALLDPWLKTFCANEALVLLMQTLITTGIIIITGEFFPKTLFRINPNTSLRITSVPMSLFYFLLYPVSLFTTWLSRMLMRLAGVRHSGETESALSVGDLNDYIERTIDQQQASSSADSDNQIEHEVKIFHNAIDFSSIHLRDCMIPRNEIVAVPIKSTSREELSALFTSSGRSKILVYDDDIDSVLGYIHVSELLRPGVDWTESLKPVLFAPESLMANKMMRRLLAEKRSLAVVVDEFGGTSGMVTLEDLVEEILGDIQDEHDRSNVVARRLSDGLFEFSGRVEIQQMREQFGIDITESDDYQTLAGYILYCTGTIPTQGDEVEISPYRFRIISSSATKLELIQVVRS